MINADLLRSLAIDPSGLDPAPPWTPRGSAGIQRLNGRHPCVRCGRPSTVAGVLETPEHGRRWVDRCVPCLVATTPRGGPQAPLAETPAALQEAARTTGVALTTAADEA
ncbi:hypothetical protein GCM10009647_058340 [Streptomyces sanglieri]|uniref:Uncharacterized protein n=1 Tax=Streptomyces sanglieri TaxID=193460 RepID=A0ABW2WMB1_9ACTN